VAIGQVVKSFYSYGEQNGDWVVCLFDFYDDGKGSQFIEGKFDNEQDAKELADKLEILRVKRESSDGY
jgi:hypothetical protein